MCKEKSNCCWCRLERASLAKQPSRQAVTVATLKSPAINECRWGHAVDPSSLRGSAHFHAELQSVESSTFQETANPRTRSRPKGRRSASGKNETALTLAQSDYQS